MNVIPYNHMSCSCTHTFTFFFFPGKEKLAYFAYVQQLAIVIYHSDYSGTTYRGLAEFHPFLHREEPFSSIVSSLLLPIVCGELVHRDRLQKIILYNYPGLGSSKLVMNH